MVIARSAIYPALAALLLTGCGGGTDAAVPDADPAAATAPSSDDTSGDSDASGTAVQEADTAGGGPGSAPAEAYCMNTAEEVAAALQTDIADAQGVANPGSGGGCTYADASGAPVLAISVVEGDLAEQAFANYRSYDGVEEVSGVGDAAIRFSVNDIPGFAFQSGSTAATLGVAPGAAVPISGSDLLDALEDLGRQAAGRVP